MILNGLVLYSFYHFFERRAHEHASHLPFAFFFFILVTPASLCYFLAFIVTTFVRAIPFAVYHCHHAKSYVPLHLRSSKVLNPLRCPQIVPETKFQGSTSGRISALHAYRTEWITQDIVVSPPRRILSMLSRSRSNQKTKLGQSITTDYVCTESC